MDAYDIFKKLTKGLTFKHKVLGTKNNETRKPSELLKKEIALKNEYAEQELSETKQLRADFKELFAHGDDTEDIGSSSETDGEMELVEGVKVGRKKEKKKKEKTEDLKKKLEIEEQNQFRNEHGIKAVGRHIPAALSSFKDMARYAVSPCLVMAAQACDYHEPTPIQRQAIPCMLEDRQILACAPTGSGKTAAFLIPIIHALGAPQGGPRALILCPTRELAQQTFREALRLTEPTELRVSVIRNLKTSKVHEREATFRKSDIVISTPNRLCYLLNQDKVNITLDKVHWLILDEADKLFEGSIEEQNDFRQQLDQILTACDSKRRRIAMFSATHTPNVAKWSRHHLRGLINITVGPRNAASNLVDQELMYCGSEAGKLVAFRQLVQKGLKPPVLVFVQSKERAKELFKELLYDGINVDVIHADRTQTQRDNVVRSFRVGRIWVLICTELMGRGIDFRGVNLVINYDFPPSAIAYIHRVGRAGRAGVKGKAITFFTEDDFANLRSIASVMSSSGCPVPEYMLQLKKNDSKRKALAKKAPRRDNISTIVHKPSKRKSEDSKSSSFSKRSSENSKETDKIKTGKNKKHRKVLQKGSGDKTVNRIPVKGKNNEKDTPFSSNTSSENTKEPDKIKTGKNKKHRKLLPKGSGDKKVNRTPVKGKENIEKDTPISSKTSSENSKETDKIKNAKLKKRRKVLPKGSIDKTVKLMLANGKENNDKKCKINKKKVK